MPVVKRALKFDKTAFFSFCNLNITKPRKNSKRCKLHKFKIEPAPEFETYFF
jgi:hypothetical protein